MSVDLDRLDDLHQSTTPGPWELGDGGWGVYITAPGDSEHVWAREQVPDSADVEFAVEAHRLLPRLVMELRVAHMELRVARKVVEEARAWGHDLEHDLMGALEAHDQVVKP